jgi:acetyl esterase/lipase
VTLSTRRSWARSASWICICRRAGACPLLVFFHGGGLCAGDRGDGQNPVYLRLARSGIAVAAVSYRLYRFLPSSPGKEAQLSADSPRYPDFIEDGAAAIAWLMRSGRQVHPSAAGMSADRPPAPTWR